MTKPKHVQLAQQIAASITALQEPVSDEQVLNVFQDCGVYGPTLGDAFWLLDNYYSGCPNVKVWHPRLRSLRNNVVLGEELFALFS